MFPTDFLSTTGVPCLIAPMVALRLCYWILKELWLLALGLFWRIMLTCMLLLCLDSVWLLVASSCSFFEIQGLILRCHLPKVPLAKFIVWEKKNPPSVFCSSVLSFILTCSRLSYLKQTLGSIPGRDSAWEWIETWLGPSAPSAPKEHLSCNSAFSETQVMSWEPAEGKKESDSRACPWPELGRGHASVLWEP